MTPLFTWVQNKQTTATHPKLQVPLTSVVPSQMQKIQSKSKQLSPPKNSNILTTEGTQVSPQAQTTRINQNRAPATWQESIPVCSDNCYSTEKLQITPAT